MHLFLESLNRIPKHIWVRVSNSYLFLFTFKFATAQLYLTELEKMRFIVSLLALLGSPSLLGSTNSWLGQHDEFMSAPDCCFRNLGFKNIMLRSFMGIVASFAAEGCSLLDTISWNEAAKLYSVCLCSACPRLFMLP